MRSSLRWAEVHFTPRTAGAIRGWIGWNRPLVVVGNGRGESLTALHRTSQSIGLSPRATHHQAKARNVILLYMGGGPSQMDLLDHKPLLKKYDGKPSPFAVDRRNLHNVSRIMASPFSFDRYGETGLEVSELLPHLSTVVDELAVVRSAVTNRIDHGEALLMMHTGRPISGFPTMGSWITYGLGTENANLPAYVAMPDGPSERVRNATSAGWLPSLFQGTPMNTGKGAPFFYLTPSGQSQ